MDECRVAGDPTYRPMFFHAPWAFRVYAASGMRPAADGVSVARLQTPESLLNSRVNTAPPSA